MANTVSFIGSFRKKAHYEIVKSAVKLFKKNGIFVMSPKGTAVCDSVDDFVIFESDEKKYSPSEIQMITLDKIIRSDAVYVCDLDGYVGRTTCYEIGVCLSRRVPLYFMEKPNDLPISVPNDHILSLNAFLNIVINDKECPLLMSSSYDTVLKAMNRIWPKTIDESEEDSIKKSVVICGSMAFYGEMCKCQEILMSNGIDAVVPRDEGNIPANISEEEFRAFKKRVSNAYLKRIRDKSTGAILVYNAKKREKDNYIGANTFVEIAMAFAWNRRIYLYNGLYEPYQEELVAWDCECLNGNLDRIINDSKLKKEVKIEQYQQLSIFQLLDHEH